MPCEVSRHKQLKSAVAKEFRPNLLGCDWLNVVKLDWNNIFSVHSRTLESLKEEYSGLFVYDGQPTKGFKARII